MENPSKPRRNYYKTQPRCRALHRMVYKAEQRGIISNGVNVSPTSGKNSQNKVFTSAFSSIRVTSFTTGRNHGSKQLLITSEGANFSIEINTIVPGVWAVKIEEDIILPPMLKVCGR